MTPNQFNAEATYRCTLAWVTGLHDHGVIDEEEFKAVHDRLLEHYRPVIGRLNMPVLLDKTGVQSDV